MNETLEQVELIYDYKNYQIDWLKGHFDIELESNIENTVIEFLKSTADCYINEILYEDTKKLERVQDALKQVSSMAKTDSIQDRCFRNVVKFIQDAIDGKKSQNYEDIYPKEKQ